MNGICKVVLQDQQEYFEGRDLVWLPDNYILALILMTCFCNKNISKP